MSQLTEWNIGVDLEDHAKFRRFSMEEYPHFYSRAFTNNEITYCEGKADPVRHFAGIFAAKEATIKACSGFVELSYFSLEVGHSEDESPYVQLISEQLPNRIHQENVHLVIRVSISHGLSHSIAMAMCHIIER